MSAKILGKGYSIIELDIQKGTLYDQRGRDPYEMQELKSSNVVYIYRGRKNRNIYIGQSGKFLDRHKEHYTQDKKKFQRAGFDQVMVIFSRFFNLSALYDVERQLIIYFMADRSGDRPRSVDFDREEVLNRNRGNSVNEYAEEENVASEVILPLWEEKLYKDGWVETRTINALREQMLVRYSPIKLLSEEQSAVISDIIRNPSKNYVVNGDAGTGKTVLLTHLAARLLEERKDVRIGIVVQPNWKKTAADIFRIYGMDSRRLSVRTSTELVKEQKRYDVLLIDEAHKLSRRYGKQHPSFNSVYKLKGFEECGSHLEILQKLGGQIVLMYDILQAIRPANLTREMFRELTDGYERKFLTTQFRIRSPKGKKYRSEDYVNGIKYLLYKDTGLLESGFTGFDPNFNREVFRDKSPNAYFGYFTENPLHQLFAWIEEDRNFNPKHINRVLAGLVEPWKQSDGKDKNITHWYEGDMKRRWNSSQENWLYSEEEDAEDQVGSVFAVQGLDLNKVGVLIGRDLRVTESGSLTADPDHFYNTNGTFTKEEMEKEENRYEFTLFVLNIYYVLLTRGIDGIRLGFWKNVPFRIYMEKALEITEAD